MPAKKSASEKVFDVAKPGTAKPDIGSKPMIVGHKSMASDPMMREQEKTTEEKQADSPPEKKPVSKITISPISEGEGVDAQKDSSEDNDSEDPKSPEESPAETSVDTQETSDASISDTAEKEVDDGKEKEAAVKDESEESKTDDASDKTATDAKPDAGKKEGEALDPAAIALERDENLKKIIESKKYRVAIKETKDRSGNRPVVMALLAIVLGAAGLFALIDSGMLDIGVKLPFSVFNNSSSVSEPNPVAPVTTPSPAPAAASAEEKPAAAESKTKTSALTIPEGYIEYKNSAYGYSVWYPKTMEPIVDGMGSEMPVTEEPSVLLTIIKKETECCSVRIESVIDVQGTSKQQLTELYKKGGAKAVAEESQRINAEDKNPNLENKTVSKLSQNKRGNVDTYEFVVSAGFLTGFFDDTVSGMVLEKPAVIIFFETSKGVIRIQAEAGNADVDKILATLSS